MANQGTLPGTEPQQTALRAQTCWSGTVGNADFETRLDTLRRSLDYRFSRKARALSSSTTVPPNAFLKKGRCPAIDALQQLGELPSRTSSAVGLHVAVVHLAADLLRDRRRDRVR